MSPPEKDAHFWLQFMRQISGRLESVPDTRGFLHLKGEKKQIKFVADFLQKMRASLDVSSSEEKNNKKSVEYRNAANKLYTSTADPRRMLGAAEEYTRSIAYAHPGSEELAIGFANRSALLFSLCRYHECLLDIERALQNNYPDEMKAKLYARRVRCLASMGQLGAELEEALSETRKWLLRMDRDAKGRDVVERTLSEQNHIASPTTTAVENVTIKVEVPSDNPKIVGASAAIEISHSHEYGRHITATRDIKPGEVLAVQKMYCGALPPSATYRYCNSCFVETLSGVPCDRCVYAVYCSTECREVAWLDYHEIECQVVGPLIALSFLEADILTLRITIKAFKEAGGFPELKAMIKKLDTITAPKGRGLTAGVYDSTKYTALRAAASLRNLDAHKPETQFLSATVSVLQIYLLATRSNMFGKKFNDGFQIFAENEWVYFFAELVEQHQQILLASGTAPLLSDEVTRLTSLSPFFGLLNHSYDPNSDGVFKRKKILYASRFIRKGEQIFDAYMELTFTRVPKAERQEKLKEFWQFTCRCPACQEGWPMLMDLPTIASIDGRSLRPNKAVVISGKLQKCLDMKLNVSQVYLTDKDLAELYPYLVDASELLWQHVRVPCQEKIAVEEKLKLCCNRILQRL